MKLTDIELSQVLSEHAVERYLCAACAVQYSIGRQTAGHSYTGEEVPYPEELLQQIQGLEVS